MPSSASVYYMRTETASHGISPKHASGTAWRQEMEIHTRRDTAMISPGQMAPAQIAES